VQDPALALVEPHQVPLCPAFQPIQVMLNGSTAFWCIYHTSQVSLPGCVPSWILVKINPILVEPRTNMLGKFIEHTQCI